MIELCGGLLEWLRQQFFGMPTKSITDSVELYQDKSLFAEAIRCESVHFLSSAVLGWLVFCLIWTILSYSNYKWSDHYIFRFSFVCGLLASVTCHIFIDGFTAIA